MIRNAIPKRLLSCFVALVLVLGFCLPAAAFASEEVTGTVDWISVDNKAQDEEVRVEQGSDTFIEFAFELSAPTGDPFEQDKTYTFKTNIGELFDIKGEDVLEIKDENDNLLATALISESEITFTCEKASAGELNFAGTVSTAALTAKDHGATKDNPVEKTLYIGNASRLIIFTSSKTEEGGGNPSTPQDPGTVDFNVLWKNAWENGNLTGAVVQIEVNPEGSIALYRSTAPATDPENTKPAIKTHKQFFVKDTIPEKGYIDLSSMEIYASIPTLGVAGANNQYGYSKGSLYAQRTGTQRYSLNGLQGLQPRMEQLTQNADESLEQFENRIKEKSLSWGVYTASDRTQTFMANFGNLGDPDDNNGVKYSDYWLGEQYVQSNPEIFGDQGPTGGNILHYYIEFDTYYPDIVGTKEVRNYADRTSYVDGSTEPSTSGNYSGWYTISNGGGVGMVRSSEVALKLVDRDDRTRVIPNAEFKLQQKNSDTWQDTGLSGVTDENGMLGFGPLAPGTYRLVQISTQDGYLFNNETYEANVNDSGSSFGGLVSNTGEFTVTDQDRFGFGTVVTNWKEEYTVEYIFESDSDAQLPEEVLALLPSDTTKYHYGDIARAISPESNSIETETGIWSFVGYNQAEITMMTNARFIGTWHFESLLPPSGEGNSDEDKAEGNGAIGKNESNPDKSIDKKSSLAKTNDSLMLLTAGLVGVAVLSAVAIGAYLKKRKGYK